MLPAHAPFTETTRRLIETAVAGLDLAQRAWLSGFLAQGLGVAPVVSAAAVKVLVLYGTESGNAEKLADRTAKALKQRGQQAVVKNMADVSVAELRRQTHALIVVSTWGDGEPPDGATAFYKELMAAEEGIASLNYSVCALGDTSYEKFCQVGKDIDAKLESLGAQRVVPRVDCDVDYEDSYVGWLESAIAGLVPVASAIVAPVTGVAATDTAVVYDKKNPFAAEVLDHVLLNGKGSAKETIHLEFSLAGSGMTYEPGDALAVVPENAAEVVADLLNVAKLSGDEAVTLKGATAATSLREALTRELDATGLSRSVLTKLHELRPQPQLAALLQEDAKDSLKQYVYGRQLVDALADFAPDGVDAAGLVGLMRKLPPRLYSIASSPLAHPDEVHLTVAAVRYHSHGRQRKGVASTFLADQAKVGERVAVYTHANKNFRLPADSSTPIIMVGPGTGVAPFRAFVEHRAAVGATGQSWLFFGDQRYLYDFLYQLEWQEHLKNGSLSRLDVAFSRDQPEKVYVQQRMLEKGKELYAWLQEGAHFYVCGDAARMAHDVHEALIDIHQLHGGLGRSAAEEAVEALKQAKRYQRDVY